jgi:hypothetical protein
MPGRKATVNAQDQRRSGSHGIVRYRSKLARLQLLLTPRSFGLYRHNIARWVELHQPQTNGAVREGAWPVHCETR